MTCPTPVDWPTLVDYWAGDLDDAATAALDEHLFGCQDCSAASARVAAVTETLRAQIPAVVPRALVERLRARGARVRENDFAPGDQREVVFSPDTDLLIHRLAGLDLTRAQRVDVRIWSASTGETVTRVESAPFDPAEGGVLIACQRHYAALPHDTVMSVAVHAPGGPPRTATYTILHRFA